MGIHIEDARRHRVDVKWPKSMGNMDAVSPQMRFADERLRKSDPGLPADRVGRIVIGVNVVME